MALTGFHTCKPHHVVLIDQHYKETDRDTLLNRYIIKHNTRD